VYGMFWIYWWFMMDETLEANSANDGPD
jgi:hypothetical protein